MPFGSDQASTAEALTAATTAIDAGRPDDAEAWLLDVLRRDPANGAAHLHLGTVYTARGDHLRALPHLARSASAEPENADVLTRHGVALRVLGRLDEALDVFNRAAALAPESAVAMFNVGWALEGLGRDDEAIAAFRRSLRHDPGSWVAHTSLGLVLERQGRLRASAAELGKAYASCPAEVRMEVLPTLSNTLMLLDRMDEALDLIDKYLEYNPSAGWAWHNRGLVLYNCGRHREAIESLERALTCPGSDHIASRACQAYPFWAMGEIEAGHRANELGFAAGLRAPDRQFGVPLWDGAPIGERTILAWHEQGVGDDILLASCYPDLIDLAAHVVIECDPRLVPLYSRSFPDATVRAQPGPAGHDLGGEPDGSYDLHCPQGTIARYLRRDIASFPDRRSYLVAAPRRTQAWAARVSEAAGASLRVGISWRSMLVTRERRLYYTSLDEWGAIFAVPGATFVNLQYDDCLQEIALAEKRFGVRVLTWDDLDLMNDFDETAALVANLDLVIAPSNTVGKLAGALGVPVVEFLSYANEFCFGEENMPWLPSMRVLQRRWDEDWELVMGRVAELVRDSVAAPRSSAASPHPARIR